MSLGVGVGGAAKRHFPGALEVQTRRLPAIHLRPQVMEDR